MSKEPIKKFKFNIFYKDGATSPMVTGVRGGWKEAILFVKQAVESDGSIDNIESIRIAK